MLNEPTLTGAENLPASTETVLIAAEAPEASTRLTSLFSAAGYKVSTAGSGGECLRLAEESAPEAVVIEAPLPDLEAVEVCRRLRLNSGPAPRCVIILAQSNSSTGPYLTRVDALAAGATELIESPPNDRELLMALRIGIRLGRAEFALLQQGEISAETPGRMERALRSCFQKNPLPMWLIDVDSLRFVQVNKAALSRYGYSEHEFLSIGIRDLVDPTEWPRLDRFFENPSADTTNATEWRHVLKDGRPVDVEISRHYFVENGTRLVVMAAQDITSRKQASETWSLLSSIVESSDDAIIGKDKDGAIVSWNSGAAALFGYAGEEVIGRPVTLLEPPERRGEMAQALQKVAQGEPVRRFVTERLHKDGHRITVSVTISPIYDTEGRIKGASAIARDVTDLIDSQKALRESEERYRLLFDLTPIPMYVVDLENLGFLAVNERMIRHYGYSRAEFLTMTAAEIWPEEEVPKLTSWCKTIGPIAKLTDAGVWKHRKKDGAVIDVHMVATRLDFGGRASLLAAASDVTERRRTEDALRASEGRYRELFENANDLIYTSDLEGNFTSVNKAGERITGYSREEILTKTLSEIVAPEDLNIAADMLKRKLDGGESTFYDLDVVAKDGHRVSLEIDTRLIYQDGRPVGVQGLGRDVTERRRLEQQLRTAQKMEAVGLLAGGIAHDFNNMLSVIIGRGELMLDGMELPVDLRNSIEEILKAGKRAASLTRQLLAFSRRQVMEPKILDLNLVVGDMEKLLHRLIGEDIELAARLDRNLGYVQADLGQIEQVIMNLAVNARDAMPQGGKLTISTANLDLDGTYPGQSQRQKPGPYVQLAVSDSGVGMSREVLQRVFEPFFTTKEKGKGTGLGLATVYGIVKQSGGYIWVYSEPGQGSTFKVYLPRVASPAETAPATRIQPEPLRGSETVLVVEDEEGLRQVARQFLTHCGYTTLLAADGDEALTIARGHKGAIDLLLTDVVLPHMSGPQIAELLRAETPGLKVLFMSGYADDAVANHGVIEPGAAFLQKPFTRAVLAAKLREVLGKSPVRESSESPAPAEDAT